MNYERNHRLSKRFEDDQFLNPLATKHRTLRHERFNGNDYTFSGSQSQSLLGSPLPGSYVHDSESYYDAEAQSRFLRSLLRMQLQSLTFPALGQLVRQVLMRSGYSSVRSCGEGQNRKTSGEGGLDLLGFAHTDLTTSLTAIQIKHHREVVPRRFVDELRGVMQRLRADAGLIVATSPFSALAKEAAQETGLPPVHLIDDTGLMEMLVERRLGLRLVAAPDGGEARWVFDAGFFSTLDKGARRTRQGEDSGSQRHDKAVA